MTGPKLVLPSLAMPWGRWVEETNSSNSSALRRIALEGGGAASTLNGQVDSLATNLQNIPSLAGIYERTLNTFSVSRGATASAFRVWDSPSTTFNAPRPDRSYTASVIANIRASGFTLDFPWVFLRINGVDNAFRHENSNYGNDGNFSIMGTVDLEPSQTLTAQFAIASSRNGTLTFSNCKLFAVFNGRIS